MPGGHVEAHESMTDAAEREYMEESGYGISVISVKHIYGCAVCAAVLKDKVCEGEMRSRLFRELPDGLAFDRSEYDGVIEWARTVIK